MFVKSPNAGWGAGFAQFQIPQRLLAMPVIGLAVSLLFYLKPKLHNPAKQ